MSQAASLPRPLKFIRWTARIWSIAVTVLWLLIFLPDAASQPIAPEDWFLLSFIGLALLGLLIGLRWELAGGIFTIAMLFLREIAWLILKGEWLWGFLFLWFLIAPPALLYILAWRMERKNAAISATPQ